MRFLALIPVLLIGLQTWSHAARELIIASPHWEGIQWEFTRAFEKYYFEETGEKLTMRWRDLGGTSQIQKVINSSYQNNPATCGIDIFFGGGIDPYEDQKRRGQLHPFKLPQPILDAIPATLHGFPIVDPDFQFYGAALSSFGILENLQIKKHIGLPNVSTWEDLTNPALRGWVSSADPRKSGSVHMIYEIILQAYGWEKGWRVIYRMSGNVANFLPNSSSPTKEVSLGDAAYAVSIDINGMTQQAFLGKENVRYLVPQGVSIINPDGIAILKGAPNLDVAKAFVTFVMSRQGQALWMKPTGAPGGAVRFGITRMGVMPSFYQGDLKNLLVPMNPFTIRQPFQYDNQLGGTRWGVVSALIGQTVIDVHRYLQGAWDAINALPESERQPLLETFDKPFITEAEALKIATFWQKDKIHATKLANEWITRAVTRYRALKQQADSRLGRE